MAGVAAAVTYLLDKRSGLCFQIQPHAAPHRDGVYIDNDNALDYDAGAISGDDLDRNRGAGDLPVICRKVVSFLLDRF